MNIYNFLNLQEHNNIIFLDDILKNLNKINFHPNFKKNILGLIESSVKSNIGHIITFEYEVALKAKFVSNEYEFLDMTTNSKEWIEYFYEEYPTIKENLDFGYDKFKKLIADILRHLNNDIQLLDLTDISLINIDIGEGDFHNGKCTCKLIFGDNNVIYYKPRSLKVDNIILKFFLDFEKKINRQIFYPVKNIDRGKYGWSFPVSIEQCKSETQVKNFYYGMGVLTAMCHALKIEDLIYDNLISSSGLIALIDLECSFCSELPLNQESMYLFASKAGELYRSSVINSGIIPRQTISNRLDDGESDGALSFLKERKAKTMVQQHNTEGIVIDFQEQISDSDEIHIPKLNGEHQPVSVFLEDYMKGFKFGYFNILENRKDFIDFIKNTYKEKVETRIIWRPTKVYSAITSEMYHPDMLKYNNSKMELLNQMYNAENTGIPREVINSEISQLNSFDIPAFKKVFGDNNLYTFSGESLDIKYNNTNTDYEQVLERINCLSVSDYNIQEKIIVQSLKVFENIPFKVDIIKSFPIHDEIKIQQSNFKQKIDLLLESITNYLLNESIKSDNDISILDIFSNTNNGWRVGPYSPGITNGIDGVMFFLKTYGEIYDNEELKIIAKKSFDKNLDIFLKLQSDTKNYVGRSHFAFSSLQFPTCLVYIRELYRFLENKPSFSTLDRLDEELLEYYREWIHRDDLLDFVSGCSGSIFLFHQLYIKSKKEEYKEIIELCANRLLEEAIIEDNMASWSANKFHKLGGFSHGTSSYATSLLLAYDATKNKVYYDLFEKGLAYDRSLLELDNNMYVDKRFWDRKKYSHSWAHGSGGIALSRLIISSILPDYEGIDDEIKICFENLKKDLRNNTLFHISGGFSGTLEILKALYHYFNEDLSELDSFLEEKVHAFLNNTNLLVGSKNHIHLTLFQGITGLGYSLLRYLYPDKVPSILISGIDNTFGSPLLYK
jgi:type 2 lantibiotic biosynthesis protein LanM